MWNTESFGQKSVSCAKHLDYMARGPLSETLRVSVGKLHWHSWQTQYFLAGYWELKVDCKMINACTLVNSVLHSAYCKGCKYHHHLCHHYPFLFVSMWSQASLQRSCTFTWTWLSTTSSCSSTHCFPATCPSSCDHTIPTPVRRRLSSSSSTSW